MSASSAQPALPAIAPRQTQTPRERATTQARGRRIPPSTFKIVLGTLLVGSVVGLVLLSFVYMPLIPTRRACRIGSCRLGRRGTSSEPIILAATC